MGTSGTKCRISNLVPPKETPSLGNVAWALATKPPRDRRLNEVPLGGRYFGELRKGKSVALFQGKSGAWWFSAASKLWPNSVALKP